MRTRVEWKLLGIVLVVVALGAGAVAWLDHRAFVDATEELQIEQLEVHARHLAELGRAVLAEPGPEADAELEQAVQRLGKAVGVRLTWIAGDGRVRADSHEQAELMDDHGMRPEVVAARRTGVGSARRRSATLATEMIYVAVRVDGAGSDRQAAFARAAQPARTLQAALARGRRRALWTGAGSAVIACALGWFLSRRVMRPLGKLIEGTRIRAVDDPGRRLAVASGDEFEELGTLLDQLADRLRERVEETERERLKLSSIIGGMQEGIIAFARDERILHVNAAACRMLGVDAAAAVGQPIVAVVRVPEMCELVSQTIASGATARSEIFLPDLRGNIRVIELAASPLRNVDDRAFGAVLAMHDVTELRRLEGVRRDFVANVSHELKTPLTAIKGLIDTMVDDPEMAADVRQRFLTKVKRQADRLTALVVDLLVLARVESGKAAEEPVTIDLRQPVRDSTAQLLTAAHGKRLRLQVRLGERPLWVAGEPEALRQVVDNLVGNAIRYTPEAGEIHVDLAANGEAAILTVRDTGIGIDPANQERIFERFYRVDKARSRELGGTGLGLAIVKHVVLSHGGTVSVQSAPQRGSSFTVRLPLLADDDEESTA